MEKLKGERFSQIMSGFDYDTAAQITVLIYKSTEASSSTAWVKVPTDKYPSATLITKTDDGKMVFTVDTANLATGKYDIEVRVDVVGVLAPIVKQRTEFMTLKQSRT